MEPIQGFLSGRDTDGYKSGKISNEIMEDKDQKNVPKPPLYGLKIKGWVSRDGGKPMNLFQ